MFGPHLNATSGISSVVNKWLDAGLELNIDLEYISTLDEYVPKQYFKKTINALRSYKIFFIESLRSIDIVHLHMSVGMSFYRKFIIFWLAKSRSIKVVVHLHGSTFKEFYSGGNGLRKKLIQSIFNNADGVFVLSKWWKEYIQELSTNKHIYIIYNGASIDQFNQSLASVEKHKLKAIVIAFMGRLGERKGVYDLLDAFERLTLDIDNVKLVLGGDGDIEKCKTKAQALNIPKDLIKIEGEKTQKEVAKLMNKSDFFLLFSFN